MRLWKGTPLNCFHFRLKSCGLPLFAKFSEENLDRGRETDASDEVLEVQELQGISFRFGT